MNFSATFFLFLVYGAIGLAIIGAVTLLTLLIRDFIKGRIW
jgi:hypothetical protein